MSTDAIEQVRDLVDQLAPDRTKDQTAAVTLCDAGFALASSFSQVLGVLLPRDDARRAELAARCLDLCLAWVPRLSQKTIKQLDTRNRDRQIFKVDLSARKRVVRKRPEYLDELNVYDPLPPLTGYEPVGACFIQKTLGIGEWCVDLKVPAKRGVWLGYYRLNEDSDHAPAIVDEAVPDEDVDEDEGDFRHEIIVIHSESRTRFDELRAKRKPSSAFLPIDGATMRVADAACAKSEAFQEALTALLFGELAGEPELVVGGRYIEFSLDGDGRGKAFVTREDNEAVLAIIEC